jgi:hypothetical protein
MNHKNKAAYMSDNDNDPYVAGAGIVKIAIIALVIMLVGDQFGIAISLPTFLYATILAVILYFLYRKVRRHFFGQRR